MLTLTEIYDSWDDRFFEEYSIDFFFAMRIISTRNDFAWFAVLEPNTLIEQLELCNENFRRVASIAKAVRETRNVRE